MKLILLFIVVLTPVGVDARKKLDEFRHIRVGGNLYRDSTVQRGFAFHADYSTNKGLSNQYYSVFLDYDHGLKYLQDQAFSDEPREFNNKRTDLGALYGLNMISNIKSRFYFGLGLGYSQYTFTDSDKIEPYEYASMFYSWHTGAEVRLGRRRFIFVEYYVKRLPTRDNGGNAYEDSFELQQANVERWIVGYAYAF